MSCLESHDWERLTAHRFTAEGREPEEWTAAVEHLESCEGCRREALRADPTLLFRRLATPPALPVDAEVQSMRQAVAALRRAERVKGNASEDAAGTPRGRWVSAAGIALLTFSLGSAAWLDQGKWIPSPSVSPSTSAVAVEVFDPVAEEAVPPMPVYEWLDGPDSRIYQLAEDPEFAMVMIVSDEYENLGV